MKYLNELKEMLCRELEEYSHKGKMSAGDLETIHKLTDTIKNIDKIEMLEENGGYSQAGGMMGGGYGTGNRGGGDSYARGDNSYDGGTSYRRQRRDSRGRYSRDGGYSYEDGMEELNELLDDMMDGADERLRNAIHRFKQEIRK